MKLLAAAALLGALSFVGPVGAQSADPYADKINSFVQGSRDTYNRVRLWQALSAEEHLAADRGVMNSIAAVPDPLGDLHPENIHPCSTEPSVRLRDVCSYFQELTSREALKKLIDPEYVRGQFTMLRMIDDCRAPGIRCN